MKLQEETTLAEELVRTHGLQAAIKASDNANAQDLLGDGAAASKWRRVMVLISEMQGGIGLGREYNDAPPSPDERRPKPRKRVLLTGIVVYANGTYSFDCTFRNLSETGARIVVGKSAQFPSDFYLINIRDRVAYEAKVVWNNGSEVGVTFQKTLPMSDITDSSLIFLKRLWLSKATG
ncbi:MAG TPA: PilZ domain-containing protein [Rhizomicrobium sp.]|nr:PilZ domain-containing protein [Rhizomicrobium sp.]